MKKFLKHLPKALIVLLTGVVLATSFSASAAATFGPDRPTKAWDPTVSGFDHVQFNSFTGVGNGVGDERDFFNGLQVGRDSTWSNPVNGVTQDAEVEAKIYIHNNADSSLNDSGAGLAHNVTVQVAMPTGLKQTQDVKADISADNAQPKDIFDTLEVTGANNGFFGLQYEAGTGQLHEQDGTSSNLTAAQESALTGTGLNLGDQKGCFQYVQEITFKMKVQMPQYTIQKQVRFAGQGSADWKESVNAKAGDKLEWTINFSNIGKTELDHTKIVDSIPAGLDVVPGSVVMYNANYPDGYVYPNDAVQANGRQVNIDLGNYNPLDPTDQANGLVSTQVIYATTVEKPAATVCSPENLTNEAFATPEGLSTIKDTAEAVVAGNTCTTPTPATPVASVTPTALPNTGAGSVVGLFAGVTIAGALVHRLFLSRKLVNRSL